MVRAEDEAARVAEDPPVEALPQGALQADTPIVLGAVKHVIELASPAGAGHEIEGCRSRAGDAFVVEVEEARGLLVRGLVAQLLRRLDSAAYRPGANVRASLDQGSRGPPVWSAEQQHPPGLEDRGCVAVEPGRKPGEAVGDHVHLPWAAAELPQEMASDVFDFMDEVQASLDDSSAGGDRDQQPLACLEEVVVQGLPAPNTASLGRDGDDGKSDAQLEAALFGGHSWDKGAQEAARGSVFAALGGEDFEQSEPDMIMEADPVFEVEGPIVVFNGDGEAAIVIDSAAGEDLVSSRREYKDLSASQGGVGAVIEDYLSPEDDPRERFKLLAAAARGSRVSPGGEAGYRVAQLDSQGGELIDPGGGFGFGDHNAIALDLVGGVAPVCFPVEADSSLAAAKADAFQAPDRREIRGLHHGFTAGGGSIRIVRGDDLDKEEPALRPGRRNVDRCLAAIGRDALEALCGLSIESYHEAAVIAGCPGDADSRRSADLRAGQVPHHEGFHRDRRGLGPQARVTVGFDNVAMGAAAGVRVYIDLQIARQAIFNYAEITVASGAEDLLVVEASRRKPVQAYSPPRKEPQVQVSWPVGVGAIAG